MRDRVDVGICIGILRRARGLNQGELAERAGVTSSAISDYERGKVDPQTQTLLKILNALGASMQLFEETLRFLSFVRTAMGGGPLLSADPEGELAELPPAIAIEIAAIANDGANFTARATRLQLGLLARLVQANHSPAKEES